ncbi:hypothetical protein BDR26DRAFT_917667 [Obelidium mucronatum]|nr:hypothetical protein BDR26DRAFT_917667 [Obelidium mucronatum]
MLTSHGSFQIQALTEKQLEQYFERIRLPSHLCASPPTANMLHSIVSHHSTTIPFENTELFFLNKPGPIEVDCIFEQLVLNKRGGYCYQNNLLVVSALKAIGFAVRPGIASLSLWENNTFRFQSPMHMIVFVGVKIENDVQEYLVDLGGLRWSCGLLIRDRSRVSCAGGETCELRKDGGVWMLFHKRAVWSGLPEGAFADGFTPVFSFTEESLRFKSFFFFLHPFVEVGKVMCHHSLQDYNDLNLRVATDPHHKLKKHLLISIVTPSFGNAVITDHVYRRREPQETVHQEAKHRIDDVGVFTSFLRDSFGIVLSESEAAAAAVFVGNNMCK